MSPTSRDVLDYIRSNPGCTSREIADHYGCEISAVSCKTSRLHDQGYVSREPEDLRQAPRGMCYRLWVIA